MLGIQVLNGFDLFKGLDENELAKMRDLCKLHTFNEGDHLFAEGTGATALHLCRSGKVDIAVWVREPWNRDVVVHRVEPGEAFGWSALVPPHTHTASAECVEAGEEIRLKGSELLDLHDENHHMGYVVMRNLSAYISARVTQTGQRLSTEWLSSGSLASGAPWGEPGRR